MPKRILLAFYWSLGHDIVERDAENKYGIGFFETLSGDLKSEIPGSKGFSPRNLRYMRAFYQLFPEDTNLPQLGAELFAVPWGHIRAIIDKCKGDRLKAEFYVRETVATC